MRFDEYRRYDALGLADLVRKREVSAKDVLEVALARTDARNSKINALVEKCYEQARAAAVGAADGPFAGVPFLIKDLAYVAGLRCSMGSRLYAPQVPDHDSTLIERYRKAGLVIYGKSSTPEFGLSAVTEPTLFGPARNPWNTDYSPGGSSGGAGAAVADGWIPAAHATDGGGSIRIPASCCGLVGLKPTRGRTPLGPDVAEGWGAMSTAHVVSRTVRDCAALLDASHGAASGDPYDAPHFEGSFLSSLSRPLKQLRIAVELQTMTGVAPHGACVRAVERAAALCERLGHVLNVASPSFDREQFSRATSTIVAANIANSVYGKLAELNRPLRDDDVEPYTLWFANIGRSIAADEYVRALHTIQRCGRTVAAFHQQYDVMLSPTLVGPPVPVGYLNGVTLAPEEYGRRMVQYWGFTNLQNATGQPAISLPLYWTDEQDARTPWDYPVVAGLPVGVQFVGRRGDELTLLQLAQQLEGVAPWRDRWASA